MSTKPALDERFWSKVDFESSTNGCWLWRACTSTGGYGYFRHTGKMRSVHRLAYSNVYGNIPEGLEIDHLCRITTCVNPSHLEAVPPHVNNMRSTSPSAMAARQKVCFRGHSLLDPANVWRSRSKPNARYCKECNRLRQSELRARRRAAA